MNGEAFVITGLFIIVLAPVIGAWVAVTQQRKDDKKYKNSKDNIKIG